MKGKFYGLVAVIIGLFFLIPAVRDLRRGYSVERNKRSGNTRISKPPEIGYYFGVGVMLSVGSVFTTLGLASILIPLQGRKRERRGNKGNQGYSIPFLETSYVRSVVGITDKESKTMSSLSQVVGS